MIIHPHSDSYRQPEAYNVHTVKMKMSMSWHETNGEWRSAAVTMRLNGRSRCAVFTVRWSWIVICLVSRLWAFSYHNKCWMRLLLLFTYWITTVSVLWFEFAEDFCSLHRNSISDNDHNKCSSTMYHNINLFCYIRKRKSFVCRLIKHNMGNVLSDK